MTVSPLAADALAVNVTTEPPGTVVLPELIGPVMLTTGGVLRTYTVIGADAPLAPVSSVAFAVSAECVPSASVVEAELLDEG